ncbi:uncharacterized protein LOC127804467 [Diospyros lotus]|uniref:uncharacterized protein LOC127804467 n=1 Tax=Diospyros lotus TaxID=55363 RepID=UPI002255AB79|nr:uncharacterized protein LOC127804467 [Diospyros lotus]
MAFPHVQPLPVSNRLQMPGQVFTLIADAEKGNEIVQGILSLCGMDVRVLFDTGSTHSFIAPHMVCHVPIPKTSLPYHLAVATPGGLVLLGSEVLRNCEIMVGDRAEELVRLNCEAYLAFMVTSEDYKVRIAEIPVVCEFPDVFPEGLPGLPP